MVGVSAPVPAGVALLPSGRKRTLSEERSSRDDVPVTEPTAFHVVPPSVEYCQFPGPEPTLVPVMATPPTAPGSLSVTCETLLPLTASSEDTSCPVAAVASSVIGAMTGAPAVSTGAKLVPVPAQLRLNVAAVDLSEPPPESCT